MKYEAQSRFYFIALDRFCPKLIGFQGVGRLGTDTWYYIVLLKTRGGQIGQLELSKDQFKRIFTKGPLRRINDLWTWGYHFKQRARYAGWVEIRVPLLRIVDKQGSI